MYFALSELYILYFLINGQWRTVYLNAKKLKNAPFAEFDNEPTILAEVTHRCISDCSKNIPGS